MKKALTKTQYLQKMCNLKEGRLQTGMFLNLLFQEGDFQARKPKANNYTSVVFRNSWGECKIIDRYFKGKVLTCKENLKAGYFTCKPQGFRKPVAICYNDERIIKFK